MTPRQQLRSTDPVLWPWALIALSFYVGLDVMLAGVAEAWDKARGRRPSV